MTREGWKMKVKIALADILGGGAGGCASPAKGNNLLATWRDGIEQWRQPLHKIRFLLRGKTM